jgi:hypothetical protein
MFVVAVLGFAGTVITTYEPGRMALNQWRNEHYKPAAVVEVTPISEAMPPERDGNTTVLPWPDFVDPSDAR